MKKNMRYLLFFVAVIVTLNGCSKTDLDRSTISNESVNATKNDEDIQENANVDIATNKESIASGKSYICYHELISVYMNNFKNLYINTDTMKTNISTVTGEMSVESTEGNSVVKYLDPEGNVLRYQITMYGETGKKVTDYYMLKDKLYVVELNETYSSPILGVGENDVLCYDLIKYIIDGDDIYCIDDASKNIIPVNKTDAVLFMTLAELDHNFIPTDTGE